MGYFSVLNLLPNNCCCWYNKSVSLYKRTCWGAGCTTPLEKHWYEAGLERIGRRFQHDWGRFGGRFSGCFRDMCFRFLGLLWEVFGKVFRISLDTIKPIRNLFQTKAIKPIQAYEKLSFCFRGAVELFSKWYLISFRDAGLYLTPTCSQWPLPVNKAPALTGPS